MISSGRIQKLKIIDDDGIIAIGNVKSYNEMLSFQETWTWKQLNDFISDKNYGNIIVFSTGREGEWTVEFLVNEESKKNCFRKSEHFIEVTDESLHLFSWGDLTSTLQFKDTVLPDPLNEKLKIKLRNGFYEVVVKQFFDPEDIEYDEENKTNFIIELFSKEHPMDTAKKQIAWAEDFPNDDRIFLSNEPDSFDDFLDELLKEKGK
nr:hypothetical protein [uncultured Chryseobacterium sp.]